MDIYADEMTTSNEFNKLVKIDCRNEEIKTILEALFYDALNIEFNAFGLGTHNVQVWRLLSIFRH